MSFSSVVNQPQPAKYSSHLPPDDAIDVSLPGISNRFSKKVRTGNSKKNHGLSKGKAGFSTKQASYSTVNFLDSGSFLLDEVG